MSSNFKQRPSRSRPIGQRRAYHAAPQRSNRKAGQYIDPSRFIRVAKSVTAEEYVAKHQFADFDVDKLIKANLTHKGYQIPSPIQDQTIPLALDGNDVIGIANTGTGKTAAFAIPILNTLMHDRQSKVLIMAPTRELALQIQEECKEIARGSGLFGVLLIGGVNMNPQLRDLKKTPRVVVGTPGRIKDHMERGTLRLEHFNMLVLDEVDRMLDMGFLPDMKRILSQLPTKRQSFFFSATMDAPVRQLIEGFGHDPKMVSVKSGDTADSVHQDVVPYRDADHKMDLLHDILIDTSVQKAIVFESTKRSAERLSKKLVTRGFQADFIHGGKSQSQRQRALDKFKKSDINILVATDVAARGIDVADITHVINYATPQSYEDYVHRIGRAGRAGRTGYALTFVSK
ncbi:MAG TPA: DEAD/DEAH box helicase [Verrucomicrobiae bacterium]|nr:DEAD/DEAH box helicase [Verrucomicrobiae bacterium]